MSTATQPAAIDFLGSPAYVLASTEELGLVRVEHPAGDMPPLHVHHNDDEGFYCLDGEITLYLPGESVTLRPGDFFLAPRGVPHTYETTPTRPARRAATRSSRAARRASSASSSR
jgi:quercetin dioxygenase-like cupin family protein